MLTKIIMKNGSEVVAGDMIVTPFGDRPAAGPIFGGTGSVLVRVPVQDLGQGVL